MVGVDLAGRLNDGGKTVVGFGGHTSRHEVVIGWKACVVGVGFDNGSEGLGAVLVLSRLVQMPFGHGDGHWGVAAQAGGSEAGEVGEKALGKGFFKGRECWREHGGMSKCNEFGSGGLAYAVG